MISDKLHVQQLVTLLLLKDITDIVISPGSRNGAIVQTISNDSRFRCFAIVDERSAAYFALGRAQATKKPVALLCTSGTATLNYSPAIAEAYYQEVPLVILTTDRPPELINQLEAQCINQSNIYSNFVVAQCNLPVHEGKNDLAWANRELNIVLNTVTEQQRPVHINIPLNEPLYKLENEQLDLLGVRNIRKAQLKSELSLEKLEILLNKLNQSEEIMILVGQMPPIEGLSQLIDVFADALGAVIIAEPLANIHCENSIENFDSILASANEDIWNNYRPDILITLGKQTVSKRMKELLRTHPPFEHWHISATGNYADTYQRLSELLPCSEKLFFEQMLGAFYDVKMELRMQTKYRSLWQNHAITVDNKYQNFTSNLPYSDLYAYKQIGEHMPHEAVIHLGNSTAVRYSILTKIKANEYYANRGTSGIDGSLSTAVGFALASNKLSVAILGDLSFFYDSNALWNSSLPDNLRIIVVNNGGGAIFGLINGPKQTSAFEQHFKAAHKYKAEGIAESFKVEYAKAESKTELNEALLQLFRAKQTMLLEIFTNEEESAQVYSKLYEALKIK